MDYTAQATGMTIQAGVDPTGVHNPFVPNSQAFKFQLRTKVLLLHCTIKLQQPLAATGLAIPQMAQMQALYHRHSSRLHDYPLLH